MFFGEPEFHGGGMLSLDFLQEITKGTEGLAQRALTSGTGRLSGKIANAWLMHTL